MLYLSLETGEGIPCRLNPAATLLVSSKLICSRPNIGPTCTLHIVRSENQTYRLGKKETGKYRPLLVTFNLEEKKGALMSNLNKLKGQLNEKIKGVSILHDLAVRQRELVRAVRNIKHWRIWIGIEKTVRETSEL